MGNDLKLIIRTIMDCQWSMKKTLQRFVHIIKSPTEFRGLNIGGLMNELAIIQFSIVTSSVT